jgi:hypothetical protein
MAEASKHKESDLEFKASGSNRMNGFRQQAFDQTSIGFDDLTNTGSEEDLF